MAEPTPPDIGPTVNYARIDDAIALHQATLALIDNLSAMTDQLGNGARAFLTIEGTTFSPLAIDPDEAKSLVLSAMTTATATAQSLGETLNELSMGLPA